MQETSWTSWLYILVSSPVVMGIWSLYTAPYYGLPFGMACLVWAYLKQRRGREKDIRDLAAAAWAAKKTTIAIVVAYAASFEAVLYVGRFSTWSFLCVAFCCVVFSACPLSLLAFRWGERKTSAHVTAENLESRALAVMLVKYLVVLLAIPLCVALKILITGYLI